MDIIMQEKIGSPFRVTFIGHREIFRGWEKMGIILRALMHTLFQKKEGVMLLIGKNGDFDRMVTDVFLEARKEMPEVDSKIFLVSPYEDEKISAEEERVYDFMLNPIRQTHYKGAISKRNEWMIDHSDLLIVYANKNGGATKALKYASKRKKKIINLADLCD